MPTTDNKSIQEAMRRTLTQRTGGAPDASTVSEAIISTWHQMADRLTPVIGEKGVDTLFHRSLQLTGNIFSWLAITGSYKDSAALLADLKARLASRETKDAVEASYTLLVTFTELLVTLIGISQTERLLRPVWAPRSSASVQNTKCGGTKASNISNRGTQ